MNEGQAQNTPRYILIVDNTKVFSKPLTQDERKLIDDVLEFSDGAKEYSFKTI